MIKNNILILLPICVIVFFSCKKSEYLEAKPDQRLLILETLDDYQAVLDNAAVMNGDNEKGIVPSLGEAASDNYYILESSISLIPNTEINIYLWNDDIYSDDRLEWSYNYRSIFYSNVVLDGIAQIDIDLSNQYQFEDIKGQALFFRAHSYFQLAQIFMPTYKEDLAETEYGLPLRITSDLNERINRAKMRETYLQIVDDLRQSARLLPSKADDGYRFRPSKAAAYGLLARTFLIMQKFDSSFKYSNECLKLKSDLLDFNNTEEVKAADPFPIKEFNKEVIFPSYFASQNFFLLFHSSVMRVDSLLYASYSNDDLRKPAFFRISANRARYKGSYCGSNTFFGGIATDEILLIRAESYARLGNHNNAIDDLNHLMIHRLNKETFHPIEAENASDALEKVLIERRKELIFRGLRWSDIRRLNIEGAGIEITRKLRGQIYHLSSNDKRYTFLLPPDVISFNPTMPQNPR